MELKQQLVFIPTCAGICPGPHTQDVPRGNGSMAMTFAKASSSVPPGADFCGMAWNVHGLGQGTGL